MGDLGWAPGVAQGHGPRGPYPTRQLSRGRVCVREKENCLKEHQMPLQGREESVVAHPFGDLPLPSSCEPTPDTALLQVCARPPPAPTRLPSSTTDSSFMVNPSSGHPLSKPQAKGLQKVHFPPR